MGSIKVSEVGGTGRVCRQVLGKGGDRMAAWVRAVATLGLPQADRVLAAQVIARVTEARLHERDVGRGGKAIG